MEHVEEAVRRLVVDRDDVDTRNVFLLGSGYGGYVVNWVNGHNGHGRSDVQFKGLIVQGGIFSTATAAYETDEVYRVRPMLFYTLYDCNFFFFQAQLASRWWL